MKKNKYKLNFILKLSALVFFASTLTVNADVEELYRYLDGRIDSQVLTFDLTDAEADRLLDAIRGLEGGGLVATLFAEMGEIQDEREALNATNNPPNNATSTATSTPGGSTGGTGTGGTTGGNNTGGTTGGNNSGGTGGTTGGNTGGSQNTGGVTGGSNSGGNQGGQSQPFQVVPINLIGQPPARQPGLGGIFLYLVGFINVAIPILIGLGLLIFLIGVLRFAFSENETVRAQSKGLMVYGVIALFVMVSVWGLVNLFGSLVAPSFSSDPSNINYKTINVRSLIP